jgi:hypothetical protein
MRIATAFVLASLAAGIAHASDPIAIYALIDKVVMEPSADNPERVQLWGTFALAVANNSNDYQPAQRGYLYFRLAASNANLARMEWNDLKAVAGKGVPVAFGSRWNMRTQVRKPDQKPENPDSYEFGTGVVRVRSDTAYAPIRFLFEKQ